MLEYLRMRSNRSQVRHNEDLRTLNRLKQQYKYGFKVKSLRFLLLLVEEMSFSNINV